MAGGEQQIKARLPGLRIEGLNHGGLLVVATDNPLPDDTEDNRRRFLQVHAALQPAFLSREETSENWRRMLGCFYRERVSVIPQRGRLGVRPLFLTNKKPFPRDKSCGWRQNHA